MKLKIISIKDKQGNEKTDFYNELKRKHPYMSGEWIYKEYAYDGSSFFLVFDDDTNRMLRTSLVNNIVMLENTIIVETDHSVYEFQKLNKKAEE